MTFKNYLTEGKITVADMLKKANEVAKNVTLMGEDDFQKLEGGDEGVIGVVLNEDSDANEWDRYPELMAFDSNTGIFTIYSSDKKEYSNTNEKAAYKNLESAFYSELLGVGSKKLSRLWK